MLRKIVSISLLCLLTSLVGAQEVKRDVNVKTLQAHLQKLKQAAHEAEERGQEEAAKRFAGQIEHLSKVLKAMSARKPNSKEHDAHGEVVAKLKEMIDDYHTKVNTVREAVARAAKKDDKKQAERLRKELHEGELKLRYLEMELHKHTNHDDHDHDGHDKHHDEAEHDEEHGHYEHDEDHEHGEHEHHGEHRDHEESKEHQAQVRRFQNQMKALHQAAEILERAELGEVAHGLHRHAENMEREMHRHHEHAGHVRELMEALHENREQIERLQHHIREMHERIIDLHEEEFEDEDD